MGGRTAPEGTRTIGLSAIRRKPRIVGEKREERIKGIKREADVESSSDVACAVNRRKLRNRLAGTRSNDDSCAPLPPVARLEALFKGLNRPMKAVVFEEFGDPADVLKYTDFDDPKPKAGEVLVRMIASPVNPSDLMYVEGGYTVTPQLPAIPGFEGVGIVEKAGRGLLGKLLVGRRVAVINRDRGNWAEKTVVSAKQAIPVPKSLDDEQAAMYFVNPATAYVLTRIILNVPNDAWLLQTAANSALGRMVIRLGRAFDFKTLNVVRRGDDVEKLKFLGANEVIVFDVDKDDPQQFLEQIKEITGGVRYAMDPVGGNLASAIAMSLVDGAQFVLFGSLSGDEVILFPRTIISPNAVIRGFWLGGWMQQQSLLTKMSIIRKISKLIGDGTLSSDVGQRFPLEQVKDAVAASRVSNRQGKVLLSIRDG